MDNTPTNGNFNDEHGHPWKLTTTQDYNKHMQYTDLGDRMIKLYDTMLDTELGTLHPPELTIPNSSSSCLSVGWKLLIKIFLQLVLTHKVTERDASLSHPQRFMFWKSYMSWCNIEQSLISTTLQFVLLYLFCMMNLKKKKFNEVQAALCWNVHSCFTNTQNCICDTQTGEGRSTESQTSPKG